MNYINCTKLTLTSLIIIFIILLLFKISFFFFLEPLFHTTQIYVYCHASEAYWEAATERQRYRTRVPVCMCASERISV